MTVTVAERTDLWPERVPRNLDYPAVPVGALFAGIARRFADRVAVQDGEEQLTYAELLAEASAFAQALRADGVREGETVLLHLPNCRWIVVGYWGAMLAGATVSPCNPLHTVSGLRSQIEDSRAVVVLSHPDHVSTVLEAGAGSTVRRVVVVPGTTAAPVTAEVPDAEGVTRIADFVAGHPAEPPVLSVTSGDVAHLAFTGGTTGRSKAVRVLHRNVIANICQSVAWRTGRTVAMREGRYELDPIGREDCGLPEGRGVSIVVGPMYHAQALLNTSFMLASGARVIIMGRFSPDRLLQMIEAERATYLSASPTLCHALVASPEGQRLDLSSLQVLTSGAAPIDLETMKGLSKLFPSAVVCEGYGLTEGTCVVTSGPAYRDGARKLGSVGFPLPDVTVEIRSEDGAVLPAGEHGELWVKGPQVTDGYAGHPELTAEQFVDGWLRTGDIGYFDEDGFLFISDRLKDMLIYKGYNVYPRELEELLVQHPAITAAAVVGREDAAVGQLPIAFVVAAPGAQPDPDEVQAYVAERVLPYKKLREVHVIQALPANAAGKILKTDLRARANN
ncbi:class I adenylate-forming enzyme family protein [Nocardioides insulae]|uniref:class I adenylate-forming enzyme family protein n=1 Tax=Nocardioides insulae TaxID=394734 RepID=UPI000425FDE8|nr:AMP-binding protein [Nocardioides insulae]